MITTARTITAAGAAALALIGGAALTGSTATADDGDGQRLPARPSERALVATCGGGAGVGFFYRSMDSQSIPGATTAAVEGSQWQVKGPKKGTDTVLVTLTSMASSGGAGQMTTASLYKDGVGTGEGAKYYTYDGTLDQASVQFCTKIRKGQHSLELRVTDQGGGATTMYYPTVTYQRFS